MSPKKVLFFIVTAVLLSVCIIGIIYITKKKPIAVQQEGVLKIWINDSTTEAYIPLLEGFKKYAPEYAKIEITVEKQTSDADRYRTLLLSTLTDGSGPDIFMLHSGEDAIIENRIEPLPSDVIDISDFDKRYDDIFQDLIASEGDGKSKKNTLKGIPIGYETLGIFYNKALMREVPKTWNDLEALYRENPLGKYPSNLGLGPSYTPNMIDILPLWLGRGGSKDYTDMSEGADGLESYLNYGDIGVGSTPSEGDDSTNIVKTLKSEKSSMKENRITTLDLFMRGEIAMIIGYPSLVLELEKASKRAGSESKSSVILTDKIPQAGSQNATNIARYTYFGISKLTKNPSVSLKFAEYLMTPEAQRIFINQYPYLIPAQSEFYDSVMSTTLSETLSRTKIGSFIPNIGETISVFNYGIKSQFERYLKDAIDTTETPRVESILSNISREISCEIETSISGTSSNNCQKE